MRDATLRRITESGIVEWPWAVPTGLTIIAGAAGGGGGGGGAFCLEGLNLFGAGGGGGGGGGGATTLQAGEQSYRAAGGDGGDGGDGGKGFPGEALIVELQGLSKGDKLEVEVGRGGGGGSGGKGYEQGGTGSVGTDGFVLFVPLHVVREAG